ncbi:hypothetical protein BH11PSE3_BH11PSE3_26950 [soil metagenome]
MKARSTLQAAAAAATLMIFATAAEGQDIPNLVGTWKGTAQAIFVGANPSRPSEQNGPVFSGNPLEFTFVIKEQRDNRISGQSSDGKRSENLIGAISPNNLGGIILDDDGQYLFTIRDSDTLDTCYSHQNLSSKVVACYTWKRQK